MSTLPRLRSSYHLLQRRDPLCARINFSSLLLDDAQSKGEESGRNVFADVLTASIAVFIVLGDCQSPSSGSIPESSILFVRQPHWIALSGMEEEMLKLLKQ